MLKLVLLKIALLYPRFLSGHTINSRVKIDKIFIKYHQYCLDMFTADGFMANFDLLKQFLPKLRASRSSSVEQTEQPYSHWSGDITLLRRFFLRRCTTPMFKTPNQVMCRVTKREKLWVRVRVRVRIRVAGLCVLPLRALPSRSFELRG